MITRRGRMATAYLTRKTTFSAAHRLHNPELSCEENQETFGKCNNPYGHGHNYTLEVTVKGEIDPRTGMVMNLSQLKQAVEEAVVEPMDHKHLNQDVGVLQGVNPTVENLVVVFWKLLVRRLPTGMLAEVRLSETENSSAVYRGE
jgi:6-pyruvoyltetrahydropterin/6-carboxytetrahydropterin synthase